jgi:nitrite reductase (NADH) large subunit
MLIDLKLKPSSRERLVVIGNGMAGCRAVEEILALDTEKFAITIIGAEPQVNYNRIMLSPLLAGDKGFDEIILNDRAWYDENAIELIAGIGAKSIDLDKKTVWLEDGRWIDYDKLILATGSLPFVPDVPGLNLSGVHTFRTADDVDAMLRYLKPDAKAVVIGGGLLGLEAAAGLAGRGFDTTVVHLMNVLMERQLDESASHLMVKALEARSIKTILNGRTIAFDGDDNDAVTGVHLADGQIVPADLVVVSAGIKPNITLAKQAGLKTWRGIKVNAHMQTNVPGVYAVGECTEFQNDVFGLVAPIWDQCRALAHSLADTGTTVFAVAETGTKLKVTGCDVYSAGRFGGGPGTEDIVYRDAAKGIYKRLVIEGDKLIGVVLFGAANDGPWYLSQIKSGEPIADMRESIIFGQAVVEALGGASPAVAVASWPDSAEICGCNGITKGAIVKAIGSESLTSLDDVRACTKASASCGSCTGLVEALLQSTLGGAYEATDAVKTMCKCTHYGHATVRKAIVDQDLTSIPEVMQAMEWSTPDGCSSCRPALNYYLLCAKPGVYVDDKQSRFINERAHGNIQKDGTFSVVPRMWGGLTSSRELRAIADVVDKFAIPLVKVTGGQRLDLFGVKKEDLPAVWSDFGKAGMVSGHAYGKALRTVKTCVGSEWCRFGTQDSTGLGVRIERATWGSWMPHKFKIAVSGCPRNCAEATIKDFGIICVDSGYELHIGGNGGIKVRVTDLLCKVATEDDVMEYCEAFIQLYREDGHYLERTAPWVERVGLQFVKDRVVEDDEGRARLAQKFRHSQKFSQTDPWAERVNGADAYEFATLPRIEMSEAYV